MPTNLAKSLKAKKSESNLSNEALAKAIGVSTVSLKGALSGKSKPNATTAKKYADFLGVETAELTAGKKSKTGKKAKAARTIVPSVAKRGLKKTGKLSIGVELVSIVASAAGYMDDKLAFAVHQAGKTDRALIARLLGV